MPGTAIPYSHASEGARTIGLQVADLAQTLFEREYTSRDLIALVGLCARGAQLLRAAYELADTNHPQAAAIVLRSLTETAFTSRWISLDSDLNSLRWTVDGTQRVNAMDDELRRLEKKRRKAAGLPAPTDADEPLGVLAPEWRTRYKAALKERRAELEAIEDLEARIEAPSDRDERPAPIRARNVPSIRKQAQIGGLLDHYALGYAWDSSAAAHPNPLAVEQLLAHGVGGGIRITGGSRPLPDPYAIGAALLCLLTSIAGGAVGGPDCPTQVDADRLLGELAALRPFASQSGDAQE